jgi:hypothetical protein
MYIYKAYYFPRSREYFFRRKPKQKDLEKCEPDDVGDPKDDPIWRMDFDNDWEITKVYVRK